MARRYYICPVDEVVDPAGGKMFQARVAKYGVTHNALIPISPEGRLLSTWTLVSVEADDDNHRRILRDPEVQSADNIASRGITIATSMESVLREIGQKLEPTFTGRKF